MKIEWKQVLVAFLAGAALAAAATLHYSPRHRPAHMMDRLTTRLSLTPDQRQKVSAILDDARAKMTALHDEVRPKYQEIKASSRAAIREVLTPDQAAKFEKLVTEMDARRQKRRERFAKA